MAGSDDETTPPGWYRQQDDPTTLRWWDGDDWTDDTMPAPEADRSRRRAPSVAVSAAAGRPARREPLAPADEDDWAAGAWAEGTRTPAGPPATRAPSDPRAADQAPRPTGTGIPAPATGQRRTAPSRSGPAARAQGAARPGTRPTPRPSGGTTPTARRAASAASTAPARRSAPGARNATGARKAPAGRSATQPRPARAGARRDEKVVQRGGTAPPVVRVVLRAALIAVLLGVGYLAYTQVRDASPDDARTLSDSERPVPEVDPDAPRLAKVVLTLNDLPRGWSAQAIGTEPDDVCDGRVPLSVIEPLESAKAAFTMGEAGPFVTNVVSTFADDEEAQAFLDLTARTIESCRTYEIDGGTSVELGALEFPEFGDESFVAEAVGTSPYGDLAGDLIYVRVGRRVASLETIAFGDSTISPELVEHLTRLVANRMA